MQDAPKAIWSIPYVSVAFFPSLKQNFIAYHSSKVSSCQNCIFEIYQLWQSGFCCCSCSFEPEIIKIGQSSHKMYSNNILKFQESITTLNACTKKLWKLIEFTTQVNKVGDCSQGWPEGSLFNSYCTKVLLLSLDCSTLPLIRTLYCWMLSREVSSTIFKVFVMMWNGIEPRSPGSLWKHFLFLKIEKCPNTCL